MLGFIILQLIVSFLLAASLAELWASLNGITIITYLSMLNLTFPANYNIMNKVMIELVGFDVVPEIDWINDRFFTTLYSEGPI